MQVLVGKPEGKRQLGRQRHRWKHGTKNMREGELDHSGSGWGLAAGCSEYDQDALGSV